ncbi:hypothetical protein R3P38DRAFT_3238111 [Favolaschia claudopus]|uniref:Uncharacterized protein n=1 Tax=Favolaschia claudopus TaxID=2862362 RepID=A0AAV9ZAP7_9AGAR
MSVPSYCTPPLHLDPGVTFESTERFFLVTGSQAREKRGVYSSWKSVAPLADELPYDAVVKYSSWSQVLRAWRVCCEAGDHDHPTPPSELEFAVSCPADNSADLSQDIGELLEGGSFVVEGSGTVRDSFREATTDFVRTGGAIHRVDNPHIAAHISRGSSLAAAEALFHASQSLQRLEVAEPEENGPASRIAVDALDAALHALLITMDGNCRLKRMGNFGSSVAVGDGNVSDEDLPGLSEVEESDDEKPQLKEEGVGPKMKARAVRVEGGMRVELVEAEENGGESEHSPDITYEDIHGPGSLSPGLHLVGEEYYYE